MDVIDGGRERQQTSPARRRLTTLLAGAVVLCASAHWMGLLASHAARAPVSGRVTGTVPRDDGYEGTNLRVELHNHERDAVRVMWVELDGQPRQWLFEDSSVAAQRSLTLSVPLLPTCSATRPPLWLQVATRPAGSDTASRLRLPLTEPTVQERYAEAVRTACLREAAQQPVALRLVRATPRGTGTRLSFTVISRFRNAVVAAAVRPTPGVTMTLSPVRLDAGPLYASTRTPMFVDVEVTSCPEAVSMFSDNHARMRVRDAVPPFQLVIRSGSGPDLLVAPRHDWDTLAAIRGLVSRRCS